MKWMSIVLSLCVLMLNAACSGSHYLREGSNPPQKSYSGSLFEKIYVSFSKESDPFAIDLFTRMLISHLIAKEVYPVIDNEHPSFPLLTVDLALKVDEHPTQKALQEYALGFSLFLLEPFFWFEVDYIANGSLTLATQNGNAVPMIARVASQTQAKWLSLKELGIMHPKAKQETLSSLIENLLNQLRQHASH